MIRVFNVPAITWTLTAFLLLSGSYYLLQGIRSHQRTDRINKGLHALMNVLMVAMLWNFAASTMLLQIALMIGAALWFAVQSVARPEFKMLCDNQGRLKCAYHALTMAGAALMIAMMGTHATAGNITTAAAAMPASHGHHGMHAAQNTAAASFDLSPDLAIPLAVFFGAAATIFLVLLFFSRMPAATAHNRAARKLSVRREHSLEALGAAAMALMFVGMA